ncbi:pyruvate dehydrogenase (acetyl-transferring) E1 component subunit alpha [Streptomyces sp. NBRC 109706]|uniref:pyruvate dehydrogenase (acetyl-transferring) E1 component subunit alpha n=1 Tax=Streptomyces sp. NBRC 109706 TaxID=1550035 RepID=UPI000783AB64
MTVASTSRDASRSTTTQQSTAREPDAAPGTSQPAGTKQAGTRQTRAKAPAKKTPAKKTAAKKAPAKKSPAKKAPAKKATAKRGTAKGAAGDPGMVQLLTPEGERVTHPDYPLTISHDELRALYRDMVLSRRFDAEATALQRQGELGLWPSMLGQEAAQIGSGRALRETDYVFPTYREHGVAWCRGVDPTQLLGMFRGVNHGGWDPNSNNFHLYTIVIGSQTLHAAGYAMGVAKDGGDAAVVAYFGDGASSQGDVAEAFTFAAVYNAPVVFFCQNNQWAISEPTERQTRVPLYQRARGYGFPGLRVDGNDVLAVLAATRAAAEQARSGQGPVLIEAFTYRMGAHTTSDDPTRYRRQEELESWEAKDPILRLRRHLDREGAADGAFHAELEAESDALAKRVRESIRTMPDPEPMAMFEHVYADGHTLVDEERAAYTGYLASFADLEGN